jgi:hypothetical protein
MYERRMAELEHQMRSQAGSAWSEDAWPDYQAIMLMARVAAMPEIALTREEAALVGALAARAGAASARDPFGIISAVEQHVQRSKPTPMKRAFFSCFRQVFGTLVGPTHIQAPKATSDRAPKLQARPWTRFVARSALDAHRERLR